MLCRAIRICQPTWDGPRLRWEDNLATARRSTRWWTGCCTFLSFSIQETSLKRSRRSPSRHAWRGSWVSVAERARTVWWVNKTKDLCVFKSCSSLNTSNQNIPHLTYGFYAEEEVSKEGWPTGSVLWSAKGWGNYLQADSAELIISLAGFLRYLLPI